MHIALNVRALLWLHKRREAKGCRDRRRDLGATPFVAAMVHRRNGEPNASLDPTCFRHGAAKLVLGKLLIRLGRQLPGLTRRCNVIHIISAMSDIC